MYEKNKLESFQKIEAKNLNSRPYSFNLVKLGTMSSVAHNSVQTGKSQTMAAINFGLSKFLLGNVL